MHVHTAYGDAVDGASVNFGRSSGLMKRLSNGRDWLITFHCVNHRVELAVKDAFKTSDFVVVDQFYMGVYNLLKNSGKIKGEIKEAAKALDIQHYVLSKITGTRFVGHRRKAYDRLLQIWPALIAAFENVVADRKTVKTTKEKLNGYLDKLRSYKFLSMTCCYVDILDSITPTSKIFETENLMPYEVMPIVKETLANIDDIIQADSSDLSSHVAMFTIRGKQLAASFLRADDTRKEKEMREKIEILLDDISDLKSSSVESAMNTKIELCESLKVLIESRFESFQNPIFNDMMWFDPKNWSKDKSYGNDQIKRMSEAFKVPLQNSTEYNETAALKEWKSLRNFVNANHRQGEDIRATEIWEKIFQYKQREYPNMCVLAQIIICLSASNSSVERAFSLLTLLLSDKRLSMKHVTMQQLMLINLNDKNWCEAERDEIIERAVEDYLEKRRSTRFEEPEQKRMRFGDENVSDEESSSDDDDDE